MKLIISFSVAALFCSVSMNAQATAEEAFAARFPYATSQTKTYPTFPASPWCGYKGQKAPPVTPAAYPNFTNGKVELTAYPTKVELEWLGGLKNATDQKAYVDSNQHLVSYSHMSNSLLDGALHCFWRSRSNGTTNIVALENTYSETLGRASDDCGGYLNAEQQLTKDAEQLQKDAEELKKDADELKSKVCSKCYFIEAGNLKDAEKQLKDEQAKLEQRKIELTYMFKNCMNFTQLFVNPPALYKKP
jgi:hypothetical protein